MDARSQLESIARYGGLTQEQIARRLDVSFPTVNAWIRGRSTPRARSAQAIEQLYHEIVGAASVDPVRAEAVIGAADDLRLTLAELLADRDRVDRLALHMTYDSNAIEGSTMTIADTRAVLFENRALANRTQVEQLEARNHHAALQWLLTQLGATARLTLDADLICAIHLRLMNGLVHDAGTWRTSRARIAGSQVVLANPAKIASLVDELVADVASAGSDARSIARLHARFEQIHPFSDGNGRVGRLLMLAMALGDDRPPPLVERARRQAYYTALQTAQAHGDGEPLAVFIAQAMHVGFELLES